jgi:ABC-type hemin transport system substrate-binding protein
MNEDEITIESDIKTIESMLGIDEKQQWAYQRLEESIERLKPHINELDERSRGIFNLGVIELGDAAQAGEEW